MEKSLEIESVESWILIPARGGSVGIPRKNLVFCAGKPLIQYVIETSLQVLPASRVLVVTDDLEISDFSSTLGVVTLLEKVRSGPRETLDEKILRNLDFLESLGAKAEDFLLTIQPTSPLLSAQTIGQSIRKLESGFSSVITVSDDRHLRWGVDAISGEHTPLFGSRQNRQDLPPTFRETGGVIGAQLGRIRALRSRIIEPVGLVVVPEREAIDIDSFGDLFEAEHWLSRAKIVIRVDAGRNLGMGHVYRGLALAYHLARHEVSFVVSEESELSQKVLADKPFPVMLASSHQEFENYVHDISPDLLVLDVLDNSDSHVLRLRAASTSTKILTIEDSGSGAQYCDAGLYDLTSSPSSPPKISIEGTENAILAPAFELFGSVGARVEKNQDLLVSFGGTDPAGLTGRVLDALEEIGFAGSLTLVTGLGAKDPDLSLRDLRITHHSDVRNMATLILGHRIAISSMGRTVFELASMAVPVLCFAQNLKESQHVHVGPQTGSVFGGLGFSMSQDLLVAAVRQFLEDRELHLALIESSAGYRKRRKNSSIIGTTLDLLSLGGLVR